MEIELERKWEMKVKSLVDSPEIIVHAVHVNSGRLFFKF